VGNRAGHGGHVADPDDFLGRRQTGGRHCSKGKRVLLHYILI
jgi:hypothetical protein